MRRLPSLTPPPGFRDSVFAAIRADQERLGRSVARRSLEDTSPSLPVVMPAKVVPMRRRNSRTVAIGAGAAIAAALLLGIGVARVLPTGSAGNLAASLDSANQSPQARVVTYAPDPRARQVTGTLASAAWDVYTATDATGQTLLLAQNRATHQTALVARAPVLQLRALTDSAVLWTEGSGASVALRGAPLAGGPARTLLATDAGVPAIDGVAAQGNTALVAVRTGDAGSQLLQLDLAPPAPARVVWTGTEGRTVASPVIDGATFYWSEVWQDAKGTHARVWRSSGGTPATVPAAGDAAFASHEALGTLVWVSGTDGARGPLMAMTGNGATRQIAAEAEASSVQVAGYLVVWRDATGTHAYDLRTGNPASIDGAIRSVTATGATGASLAWTDGNTLYVFDAR